MNQSRECDAGFACGVEPIAPAVVLVVSDVADRDVQSDSVVPDLYAVELAGSRFFSRCGQLSLTCPNSVSIQA
jgi:hypothetical protein